MIYRLRKKFIKICTLSFLAVFLLLLAFIQLITYLQMKASLDELADVIADNDGGFPDNSGGAGAGQLYFFGPETPFSTRFFTVYFDEAGSFLSADTQSIASVTQTEALGYGESALEKGWERGWIGDYRYKVYDTASGSAVVFISGSASMNMNRSFLGSAALVFIGGGLVVLLIIILSSKRAVKPMAESYEKQKQFITDVNHELKTPLTLIRTNLDILEAEQGKSEWLTDIREETGVMASLVDRLVSLARMDEEQVKLEKETFSLSDAVLDTVSAFASTAEKSGKTLSIHIAPGVSYHGNEEMIRQLTAILLDNGVKYCDPQGTITITLTGGRHPVLAVENDCTAVNDMELSRLFDRFYRADRARTYGSGFGIGLSIAKGIVEKHHGEIQAQNIEACKIRFLVRL